MNYKKNEVCGEKPPQQESICFPFWRQIETRDLIRLPHCKSRGSKSV